MEKGCVCSKKEIYNKFYCETNTNGKCKKIKSVSSFKLFRWKTKKLCAKTLENLSIR